MPGAVQSAARRASISDGRPSSRSVDITNAALGDLAGTRGAALLVIDEVLEPHAVDQLIANRTWSGTA